MALNAAPLDVDSFNGKRVMFITAHPDDIEGFAGGLVSTLGLDTNRSVEIACVPSGRYEVVRRHSTMHRLRRVIFFDMWRQYALSCGVTCVGT